VRRIEKFRTNSGREPFLEWFQCLEPDVQCRVDAYIVRVSLGGAVRNVKRLKGLALKGISEIRIDSGPGYRVYFAEPGRDTLLLLNGGTKRTQESDLKAACEWWRQYVSRQIV
jgi:putative addiction module killer protein